MLKKNFKNFWKEKNGNKYYRYVWTIKQGQPKSVDNSVGEIEVVVEDIKDEATNGKQDDSGKYVGG